MFEYHGWIAIKFKSKQGDKKNDESLEQIRKIKALIDKYSEKVAKFEIFYQMGKPFVRLDGCLSHYQGWVLKLFFAIAKLANNSEGILFIQDEDNPFLNSRFRIWQMMEGEVLSGDMTFFPDICNPVHNGQHAA